MTLKRKLISVLALFFLLKTTTAQDIHFSQFYMSPLTINPALAGALNDMQALVNYKEQWRSVAAPFTTMAASYDMKFGRQKTSKGFWAAGLNCFSDKAGDANMSTAQVNLTAAYHVFLGQYSTLGAGFQGGFVQRSISYGALQWGNQYDGHDYNSALPTGEPIGAVSITYPDLGAGLLWSYNNTSGEKQVTDNHDLKINAGASLFHMTQPNYSFYGGKEKLYYKYVVHGNALIALKGSNLALVPGFMFSQQGPAMELYSGSMVRYKLKQDSKYTGWQKGAAFSVGAFYRLKDAVAATMLFEYANYAIGVSYDVNTSPLKTASYGRGGMEISLRFINPNPFLYKGTSQSRF